MSDSSKSALSLISMHRGYSESEQRIVDYILEHQSEAPRLTAAQLSRAAATSEATVSRFCRKLGFGSFRSFQFSLARDLESQRNEGLTDEVSLDNMEQSLKNILAAKVSELNATIDGIDHDTLAAVVHAFKTAGAIEFAAVVTPTPSHSTRRLSFHSWAFAAWQAPSARPRLVSRSRCALAIV